jgi:hypothetical protein
MQSKVSGDKSYLQVKWQGCVRDLPTRDRNQDVQRRDETETLPYCADTRPRPSSVETRPRRDVGMSGDRLETRHPRARPYIIYVKE